MIPNIFISSTIADLHYLRDAIRDTVSELGYNPIMADYGDIGYLPHLSVEDSCYNAMKDCQLVILIIGKRYGSISNSGLSITQNEFRTARLHKIPTLCLIDKEVLSYKKIYEANKKTLRDNFPEMDKPKDTFEFINEFIDSSINNGYRPFETVNEARFNIKRQIAHIFGNMLRDKVDPVKSGIQDIISEIKTLRHEFGNTKSDKDYFLFLRTTRLIIDDKNKIISALLKKISNENIDEGITVFMKTSNLEEIIMESGWTLKIENIDDVFKMRRMYYGMSSMSDMVPMEIRDKHVDKNLTWGAEQKEREIIMNPLTKEYIDYLITNIKEQTAGSKIQNQ